MKPYPTLPIKNSLVGNLSKILISHKCAPGDVVVLSAFIRDLALTYPHVRIGIDNMHAKTVFTNNPYIKLPASTRTDLDTFNYMADYGAGIKEQKHGTMHFLSYFHRVFERKTGIHVPVLYPYPDLHLSEHEATVRPFDRKYWAIFPGGKTDMPAKAWNSSAWQQVVDHLWKHFGIRCIQMGSTSKDCWNPVLDNVVNLVGKTSLRDMFRIINHADGVICGITSAMHIAAGLHRPCVVIAGGREAWWWEAYVNENTGFGGRANGKLQVPHRYLHTIGQLDCCETHGCWRSRLHPLHHTNGKHKPTLVCTYPEDLDTPQAVSRCLKMITVEHVVEAVLSYYEDGTVQWPITSIPAYRQSVTSYATNAATADA